MQPEHLRGLARVEEAPGIQGEMRTQSFREGTGGGVVERPQQHVSQRRIPLRALPELAEGAGQEPNQRARRLEPKCSFSATRAVDGAW